MSAGMSQSQKELLAGGVLLFAAIAALLTYNLGFDGVYRGLLDTKVSVSFGEAGLAKPLVLWINDGLMAIFFFLVGLELKREILVGQLKQPRDAALPALAALGGVVVPALIFLVITAGYEQLTSGWAIPAATDIAFAVGLLAIMGSRVPPSVRLFLLALAIIDDLAAIIIIALFYTGNVNTTMLMLALIPLVGMFILNRRGVGSYGPYIALAIIMWLFVLKSSVHATLAGVVAAFMIPMTDKRGKYTLETLEHALHPYVAFLVVPIFAFANAGVALAMPSGAEGSGMLALGIALGLLVGKPVGIMAVTWLTVRFGIASLPKGANWAHIFGASLLAGVGFTMSLFIGQLAFADDAYMSAVRIGVMSGSLAAALLGLAALMKAPSPKPSASVNEAA